MFLERELIVMDWKETSKKGLGAQAGGRDGVQWLGITLPVRNGWDWGILLSRRRLPAELGS